MKILYVEDELYENLDRIINLFHNFLETDIIDKIKETRNDSYGVVNSEIKKILDESKVLESMLKNIHYSLSIEI